MTDIERKQIFAHNPSILQTSQNEYNKQMNDIFTSKFKG